MNRPLLLRVLPERVRELLYYRRYRTRHDQWLELFEQAPLAYCPQVAMYGLPAGNGDVISGSIALTGSFELVLTRRFVELSRRPGLLVDVGANMGYFSLLWAGLNPMSHAIAFEPSPRNVGLMRNNIVRNRLEDRITVVPQAVGDRTGTILFDVGQETQTGWGGISTAATSTTTDVPIVRLDEELRDREIDVLKIDVEGADTLVLRGCEELLKRKLIRTIFFEQNLGRMKKLGIDPNEGPDFVRSHGYKCVALSSGTWTAVPA